jgi:hypothetical protein
MLLNSEETRRTQDIHKSRGDEALSDLVTFSTPDHLFEKFIGMALKNVDFLQTYDSSVKCHCVNNRTVNLCSTTNCQMTTQCGGGS